MEEVAARRACKEDPDAKQDDGTVDQAGTGSLGRHPAEVQLPAKAAWPCREGGYNRRPYGGAATVAAGVDKDTLVAAGTAVE